MNRILLPAVGATAKQTRPNAVAAVIATVTDPSEASAPRLRELPAAVAALEVRADLVGDLDPISVRRHFPGRLIYTLRSTAAGGHGPDRTQTRYARLRSAAAGYDMVDLEYDRDITPEVLDVIPAHQRRISWLGGSLDLAELGERFHAMAGTPAELYLLAPEATSFDQAVVPLELLGRLQRDDVTAYATGPVGGWTRVLAPWLGAPVVSGPADRGADWDDPPVPTVHQLLSDYPFPALPPLDALHGVVARAVNTAMFVRLFNAGYRELGLTSLCLRFTVPDVSAFQHSFWQLLNGGAVDRLGTPVKSLTVTSPYKESALTLAGTATPRARDARAANLVLRRDNGWQAGTSNGTAMRAALAAAGFFADHRRVAVIGCGGAGRAAAAALRAAGADVTLVNRTAGRGQVAADLLNLPFAPLSEFDPGEYEAIVHATMLRDEVAFDVNRLRPGMTVGDFVRVSRPTALIAAARSRGLRAVDGHEVLRHEVARHFLAATGHRHPRLPEPK